MLTLITATPGSGKTLKALSLIFDFLNEGRNVWTNIDGIKISGVRTFKHDHVNPFDWRKLQDGSVVIYNEAQKHPAFAKKDMLKKYPKDKAEEIADIAWDLDYHRHNGYDIVLITQSPKLLNQQTLDFVGEHLHLRRIFGAKQATIFHFPEHKLNPNTKSVRDEAINKETFIFPKHLYKFYESATVHTHKTKIPLKFLIILLVVFVGFPTWFYLKWKDDKILNNQNLIVEHKDKSVDQKQSEPINNQQKSTSIEVNVEQQEQSRIAMVIESSTECYAKNSYGDIIDITVDECRKLSSKNSRMSFAKIKKDSPLSVNQLDNSDQNLSYKPPIYPQNTSL
ncbi:zonular occludens toxin domain-containing protein [Acinetobacter baumannii]|nr:zonular occludens toxin domain-containing protein [Acinetobacter baumannii]